MLCEDPHREEGSVTKEIKIERIRPQAKDCQPPPEVRRKLPLVMGSPQAGVAAVPPRWNFPIST